MSIEELYAGGTVNEETLEELVDQALSSHDFDDHTEEQVRRRVLYVEALDTLERLEREEIEETRDNLQDDLDQVFTRLARRRKEQVSEEGELRGTRPDSHIIDAFGDSDAGKAFQKKYHVLNSYVERKVSAANLADNVFKDHVPSAGVERTDSVQNRVVDYLGRRVEEGGVCIEDIDTCLVMEAIRESYTEEEYRQQEQGIAMAADRVREVGPDPVSVLEKSGINQDEVEKLKKFYQRRISEFAVSLGEGLLEVFPYQTADDIYG